MARVLQGDSNGKGKKFGIVVSRFNSFITDKLLEGAIDGLTQHGVADDAITVAWTPGAFEIPLAARTMARSTAIIWSTYMMIALVAFIATTKVL